MIITKPEKCNEKHLEFLDRLRDSGITNMFGAAPYLQSLFPLTKKESREILTYWMKTFSDRNK